MVKRTLYFGQDAYLSVQKKQLVVRYPDSTQQAEVPIEDIGVVVLDHYRLTLSSGLLNQLLAHNVAVISCNDTHLPVGLFLTLDGHSQQLIHTEAQLYAHYKYESPSCTKIPFESESQLAFPVVEISKRCTKIPFESESQPLVL